MLKIEIESHKDEHVGVILKNGVEIDATPYFDTREEAEQAARALLKHRERLADACRIRGSREPMPKTAPICRICGKRGCGSHC